MIWATQDLEVSVISPVAVPAVGDQPILRSVLNTPSENANGMSTQCFSCNVLIDARLVLNEIFVDGEGSFNWSICVNLHLDVVFVALNRIRWLSEMLVSLKIDLVVWIQAFVDALRCLTSAAARHSGSVHVMLTRLNLIWLTSDLGAVRSSANDSFTHPVRPCGAGEAAIASKSAGVTARDEMFRGQTNMNSCIRMDTRTITHRFSCAESLKLTKASVMTSEKISTDNAYPATSTASLKRKKTTLTSSDDCEPFKRHTWSRISPIVGQFGHCSRESKFSGKSLTCDIRSSCNSSGRRMLRESGWTPIIFLMLSQS